MPVPTLNSFVEEHPEQYYRSSISDKSRASSSRRSSVASCFSPGSSPLSSPPTTPGLDVIDPRILKPIDVDMEDKCQHYDQAPFQLDSFGLSMDELETKDEIFSETIQPSSPVPSFLNPSSEACEDNEAPKEPNKALQTDCPIFSHNQTAEGKRDEQPPTQAKFNNKTIRDGQVDVCSVRGPLTRAKARSQLPLNHADDFGTRKPRQKLRTQEKRKLLELKCRGLTLRQVGPDFADIDKVFLRQIWEDMKPPQRCTRSRANRTGPS
jgi:hypothetical protein